MATSRVRCPVCGKMLKSQGKTFFQCCGSSWKIAEHLIGDKDPIIDAAEPRDVSDVVEAEEIDVNQPRLPGRKKTPKVETPKDDLICPFCGDDVWETKDRYVYYCDKCRRYLTHE